MPGRPASVADCNCSLCTRLGTLWAYYPDADVAIAGTTVAYVWGDRTIGIHHCPVCGCTTHWRLLAAPRDRIGINARLLDGGTTGAEVRRHDGASR